MPRSRCWRRAWLAVALSLFLPPPPPRAPCLPHFCVSLWTSGASGVSTLLPFQLAPSPPPLLTSDPTPPPPTYCSYLAEVEASIRSLGHLSDEVGNVEHEQAMEMSASRNLLLKTDLFISVTLMFVAAGSTVRQAYACVLEYVRLLAEAPVVITPCVVASGVWRVHTHVGFGACHTL